MGTVLAPRRRDSSAFAMTCHDCGGGGLWPCLVTCTWPKDVEWGMGRPPKQALLVLASNWVQAPGVWTLRTMTVGRGLSLLWRCTGFGTGRFYRHGGTRFYLCPQLELACACLLSALNCNGFLDMGAR